MTRIGPDRHGIEPLPPNDRTLSSRGLFAIWFAPGLGLVPFGVGMVAAARIIGLGWWDGLAAIVLGSVAAAGLVAAMGVRGAPAGVPQVAAARSTFGRSIVLPAVVDWAGLVTWSGIFALFAAQALAQLTGGHVVGIWLLAVGVGQAALAVVGMPLIRRYNAAAAVALTIAFAALTVVVAGQANLSLGDGPTASPATFVLMLAVAFGLNLGWAVTAADYTRYVAPTATPRVIFGATFAGLVVPAIWLEGLGLAVARVVLPGADPVMALNALLGEGAWGAIAMAAIVVATLAAGGMLLYSASLVPLAAGLRVARQTVALASGLAALAVAAVVTAFVIQGWLENVALLVSYWIPAWIAIVLLDTRRRAGARAGELPPTGWRVLPWGVNACIAWLLGMAAAIPFIAQTLYVGPLAGRLGGADLGYPAAFIVGGAAYLILGRLPSVRGRPATAAPAAGESVSSLRDPAP